MKLITEEISDIEFLTEGEGAAQKHYIHGVFMQAEIPNRNKRKYPLPILENEVSRYVKEHVSKNRAWGELGHPSGPSINLDRACLLIKEIKKENNDFIGKAQITTTPMGDIVRGLLSDGANLGVSSRALGSLKPLKEGINEVQNDLRLLAVDVVADPSAPNAYVNGIMEGVEYWYDAAKGTIIEQHLDDIKKGIHSMTLKEIEDKKMSLFEQFINGLIKR